MPVMYSEKGFRGVIGPLRASTGVITHFVRHDPVWQGWRHVGIRVDVAHHP